MTEDKRDAGDAIREGVRSISGILGALKDALEETFDDLRKSGELSPERAREAARSTMQKAQDAVEDVRGRLDFVTRREFDALKQELDALRARVDAAHPVPANPAPGAPGPAAPHGEKASGSGGSDRPGSGAGYRFEVE